MKNNEYQHLPSGDFGLLMPDIKNIHHINNEIHFKLSIIKL